ncbi:MAG TPA: class I SAM-dependent methyltransferase [Acidimicrobiales bacterium]|nr:class I SAM-dependent methyltransferase [Acidimicrobiales bacterium]
MPDRDRWQQSDVPRGADYDRRFERLAASGLDVHGEAALVASYDPTTVLDAGCGTGRVAIELDRRGHDVVGVDADAAMLEEARAKAPGLTWLEADLTDPALAFGRTFDVVLLAGNVLLFVPAGTERRVIANAARWLAPGGRLVAGYSLRPGGLQPSAHDAHAEAAGLELEDRWATWDRRPWAPGGDYAVSVHRNPL